MADIKISTKRLQKDNDTIDSCIKDMRTRYSNLMLKMNNINSMWDGEAKKTFEKAYKDDLKSLFSLIKSLESLSAYEETAKFKYDACENRNMSKISSF